VRRTSLLAVAAAAALAAAAPADAAKPTPLEQKLARALVVPHVAGARSAAVAVDLATGKQLFGRNETLSLAPASNEKLPLTYALLTTLGPSFRIETDVLGEGQQAGATWQGNLVLKGYGDPSLASAGLRALATQVRAAGIRRVSGTIVGDESWFDAWRTVAGWKPSFYVNESPPLSALVVDRDRVGRTTPREPALAAAAAFRAALRAQDVAVPGAVSARAANELALPLGSVRSPTLAALVRYMDRESDNFTAEMLLKELGAVAGGHGTSAAGAAAVTRSLTAAAVPLAGVRIVDGSGLSQLDRLTARSLASLLATAWAQPVVRPTLVAALPVAGVSGTLQDRMRRSPARGNVVAKTGTTEDASALSGYVRDRYAFAVLQNGHPLSYWWARVAQDRFATVLAAQ
jgi:D-alanyl-D-alanine carboxypeptidase/D-alanyl-D-alanine-endopeptidase (penicillin-binding protein 4)